MISPASGNAPEDQPSFLATIGHELRNPLSCILAQAEMLQDGLHGPVTPAQQAVLQSIQNEVHRTLSLITDLADLGRIEANALVLTPAACHLQTLQRQVLEVATSTAAARSVRLTAFQAPDAEIRADETRLRQVVFELLSAVLLSAPLGGQAWLAMTLHPQGALQIQAGSGLSQEEFARTPPPPADDAVAATVMRRLLSLKPLGMSLLRKLVRLQGGTFTARATADGAVCLSVNLPPWAQAGKSPSPAAVPAATPPPAAAPAPAPPLDRAPVILLADDQPTLVTVTTHYLENLGFEVHNARDGEEAILKTQQLRPDLILMDVRMPVLEGPQAIQAIRGSNDAYMRTVPIISLSGQPGPADRDRCLAAGATSHLSKPFGVRELDSAIRQFVTPPAA